MSTLFRPMHVLPALALCLLATEASAVSFRVQCPDQTTLHPLVNSNGLTGQPDSTLPNPAIKCQQISGGDGFATMGDGTQTYLFAFGPLSGLKDIYDGRPGTEPASVFNQESPLGTGTPSSLVGMPDAATSFNGAIGLVPDPEAPA